MTDLYADDRGSQGSQGLRSLGAVPIPNPERVTAVAVVPVERSSGRVLGVRLADRGLDIPGGHRQAEDADLAATARRECREEASVEVGDLFLLDVVESDHYGAGPENLTYMVIYSAYIHRMLPFAASAESHGRELVSPSEFLHRYSAGDRGMMWRWIDAATTRHPRSDACDEPAR